MTAPWGTTRSSVCAWIDDHYGQPARLTPAAARKILRAARIPQTAMLARHCARGLPMGEIAARPNITGDADVFVDVLGQWLDMPEWRAAHCSNEGGSG